MFIISKNQICVEFIKSMNTINSNPNTLYLNNNLNSNFNNNFNNNLPITGVKKNNGLSEVIMDHKWNIIKAVFYSFLFYFFTSPNLIDLTSNYIPSFIGTRLAHTILFGLFYLLLNWKN